MRLGSDLSLDLWMLSDHLLERYLQIAGQTAFLARCCFAPESEAAATLPAASVTGDGLAHEVQIGDGAADQGRRNFIAAKDEFAKAG